jgi:putative endonuclease
MTTTEKGRLGEDAAVKYLEEAGMQIVARNYRSRYGEIDIVAMDHGTLAFVEVKAWKTVDVEELEFGITGAKQRKIIQTAKSFLLNHIEYNNTPQRFDVLFFGREGTRYLAEAFMESV